jgi:hypothetical protein
MTRFMQILRIIPFSLLYLALTAQGQVMVLNAPEVPVIPGRTAYPDVEGKVLVSMDIIEYQNTLRTDDTITVFPGWPVAKFGTNERGGVFGNMDNDPELEIVYSVGQKTYAFNLNGTLVGGWPRILDYPADGAPAFGDIDGDGFGEVVVTTHQTSTFASGTVYAFEKNGANVFGFPVTMDGGPLRTPVLADLDDDGAEEIIVAIRLWPEGFIHVYKGDGSMFPNFPVRMDYSPGSAVAVGDITGDGVPEIVAESYYSLHAFNLEGVILPGFPYYPGEGRVFSYSSPVLADIDGDGTREIICGDHSTSTGDGAVHVVKSDGTTWPGWPKYTNYWIYGPPSVGDINGDGELDIVVGDELLSTTPVNKVYAWTASTGESLQGFPISDVNGINSQIILADFDNDSEIELMCDDNTATNTIGRYRGFNNDGTEMEGWPLETQGTTFFINPFVSDLDYNGVMEISGGGWDQDPGNTNLYLWNANVPYNADLAILPILQYNTRHNGVYGDYLMVGMEEQGGMEAWGHGGLVVWPNPAGDKLTVSSQQSAVSSQRSVLRMTILDLQGRVVKIMDEIPSLPFTLDISTLDPGLYILRMKYYDGTSSSTRFIKTSK